MTNYEDIPAWSVNVPPSDGVHVDPSHAGQWDSLSENQTKQLSGKLLESILSSVVEANTGLFIPGPLGSAGDQISEWSDTLGKTSELQQWIRDTFTGYVEATPSQLDDWLLDLVTDGTLEAALEGNSNDLQQWFYDKLTGFVEATPSQFDDWLLSLLNINSSLNAAKVLAGEMSQDRITNLSEDLAARLESETFDAVNQAGTSIATDPRMSIPGLWKDTLDATLEIVTDRGYWGFTSLKMTALRNGVDQWPLADLIRTVTGNPAALVTQADDKFEATIVVIADSGNVDTKISYLQALMEDSTYDVVENPGNPPTTEDAGIITSSAFWQKIRLNVTVPTGYDTIRFRAYVEDQSTVGDAYYWDTPVIRETTKPDTLMEWLTGGQLDTQAAIDAGIVPELPQDRITDLPGDMDAKLPRETFDAITPGGRYNSATDPTMSTASMWEDEADQSYAIANIGYWGAKSLELTCLIPANFPHAVFIRNSRGEAASLIVTPGDKFDFRCQVRAKAGNATPTWMRLQVEFLDSAGVEDPDSQIGILDTPTSTGWTQLDLDVVVPAGYDTAIFFVHVNDACTAGDVYYVDNPIIKETTAPTTIAEALFGQKQVAATIQTTAVPELAQAKITDLEPDLDAKTGLDVFRRAHAAGTNWVLDPTFDVESNWNADSAYPYGILATNIFRSAPSSWRLDGDMDTAPTIFSSADGTNRGYTTTDKLWRVQAGMVFYYEYWYWADVGNANNAGIIVLNAYTKDSTGTNVALYTGLGANVTMPFTLGQWNKVSAYYTVPAGYDRTSFYIQLNSAIPDSDTFYFDDLLAQEVTDANQINQNLFGADVAATAILASAVPVLDASKVTTGDFAQSRVTDLEADLAAAAASAALLEAGLSAAANLIPDPGFEDAALDTLRAAGANGYVYATDQKHSGARALKNVFDTVANFVVTAAVDENVYFAAQEGQVFFLSQWIFLDAGNSGNGNNQIRVRVNDSSGTPLVGYYAGSYAVPSTTGAWVRQSQYVGPMPAGAVEARCIFGEMHSSTPAGDIAWLDDIILADVTDAWNAQAAADAAQVTADTATVTADAATPRIVFDAITPGGRFNIATDPTMSTASLWQNDAYLTYSIADIGFWGTKSLAVTVVIPATWPGADFIRNSSGGIAAIIATPGDRFDFSAYVRRDAAVVAGSYAYLQAYITDSTDANPTVLQQSSQIIPTTTGWTKLSMDVTIPAGYDTVRFRGNLSTPSTGDVYYWDTPKIKETTAPTNIAEAIFGQKQTATTIIADAVPTLDQSKIDGLGTALDSKVVNARFDAYTSGGANLATNPSFADSSQYLSAFGGVTYSTEQKRTGAQSVKVVLDGSTNQTIGFAATTTGWQYIDCGYGQKFYCEMWVYGAAGNIVDGSNAFQFGLWLYDDTGFVTTATTTKLRSDIGTGAWVKLWTVAAIPNDLTIVRMRLVTRAMPSTTNDAYYIDSVTYRDITEAYDAAADAAAAQDTIDKRSLDFENLVAGSGFEAANPWPMGTGMSIATDQYYGGAKSLKMYGTTGYTSIFPIHFEVLPGEQFHVEFYARRDSAFDHDVAGSPDGSRFRLTKSTGSTFHSIYFTNDVLLVADTWYKITKIATVPSDVGPFMQLMIFPPPSGTAGTVWLDDITVRRVKTPDAVGELPQSKITDLTTELPAAQAAADTAQGTADAATPRIVFDAITPGGSNIATDPTMSTASLWNDSASSSYAIANIGFWGTKSLEITCLIPASYPSAYFIRDSNGDSAALLVTPADKFDLSCWVRSKATNSNTVNMALQVGIQDSTGVLPDANVASLPGTTNVLPNSTSWTKMTADVTIPAGYDTMTPRVYIANTCVIGDVYYVDNPVLRETTSGTTIAEKIFGQKQTATTIIADAVPTLDSSKITTGDFAQARVTGLGTDLDAKLAEANFSTYLKGGANLLLNGSFDDTTMTWGGGDAERSSDYSRSGVYSMKITGTGAAQYIRPGSWDANGTSVSIKANAGQAFYYEAWVFGHPANTLTGGSEVGSLGLWCYDIASVYQANVRVSVTADAVGTNSWVKISGIVAIPNDPDIVHVTPLLYCTLGFTSPNVYYFDDILLRDVTEVVDTNQSLYAANTSATTILTSAVPSGIDATKVSEGVLADAQIPALAQSKITGLSTSLVNLVSATTSSNLVADPTITSTDYWNSLGTGNSVTTDEKRSGTRSLQIVSPGGAARAIDLLRKNDGSSAEHRPVVEGDRYRIECYVKGDPGNTGVVEGYLQQYFEDSSGVLSPASYTTTITINPSAWTYEAYDRTVPAGYDQLRTLVACKSTTLDAGNLLHFDDISVTNISNITDIISTIVDSLDGTGLTLADLSNAVGAIPGGNIASSILAAIVPTLDQTKIDGLGTELTALEGQAVSAATSGANLFTNSGFENTDFYLGGLTYSTEQAYEGTYSAKYTAPGTQDYLGFFAGTRTGSVRIPAQADDYYYWEMMIYPAAGNVGVGSGLRLYLRCDDKDGNQVATPGTTISTNLLTNSTWQKVSGYLPVGNVPSVVNQRATLSVVPAEGGNVYYFDNIALYRVTESLATNHALFSQDSPGAAIIASVVPTLDQTKIDGLGTSLDAKLAAEFWEAGNASNIASDPGMETASMWQGTDTDCTVEVSAEQAYSGTGCVKFISTSASSPYCYMTRRASGLAYTYVPVVSGVRTYLFSAYVRAKVGNGAASQIRIYMSWRDKDAAPAGGGVSKNIYTVGAAPTGSWEHLSVTGTAPADAVDARFIVQALNPAAALGDAFYVDQAVVVDITEGYQAALDAATAQGTANTGVTNAATADGKAVTAQGTADTAVSNAATAQGTADAAVPTTTFNTSRLAKHNIVSNPSFENTDFYIGSLTYNAYTTAQARTGSRSVEVTPTAGAAGWTYLSTTENSTHYIAVKAGDVLYYEAYFRGHVNNVGTVGSFYLYGQAFDGVPGGALTENLNAGGVSASAISDTSWIKASGYITYSDPDTRSLYLGIYHNSSHTTGDIFYIDDAYVRFVTDAQELNQALYGTTTPASAILTSAVPTGIDATKISGELATGNIPALDASKVTSGTMAQDRIATLVSTLAAKLTSSSTLNADKLTSGTLPTARISAGSIDNTKIGSLDGGKINTGSVNIARIPTGDLDKDNISDLGGMVDEVTNSFLGGDSLVGAALASAREAMDKMYGDLAKNTRAIQDLQSTTNAAQAKGKVVSIDFGDYADGDLPAVFDVSYTGVGTSTLGVEDGIALWRNTNNADRQGKIVYNGDPTETDYQIMRGTMYSPPQYNSGTGPYFYAIGRVGNSGNNYIWARGYATGFMTFKGDMGYAVNGVETAWHTGISLTWSMDMSLVCGVGDNPRQYQVWSGSTLVKEHVEVGTSSSMGSSYRLWGSIAEIKGGTFSPDHAGKLAGASVADNEPPTVNGSCARMYRASTGSASLTGGSTDTVLPASFFDNEPYQSPDITSDTVGGTFTVTESKPYLLNARILMSNTLSVRAYVALQVKPDGGSWATTQDGEANYHSHISNLSLDGHWMQYLNAGDQVRLATYSSAAGSYSYLIGESGGRATYFDITGAG